MFKWLTNRIATLCFSASDWIGARTLRTSEFLWLSVLPRYAIIGSITTSLQLGVVRIAVSKGDPEDITEWLEAEQAYRDAFTKGLYHIKAKQGELGEFDIEDAQSMRGQCWHNAKLPECRSLKASVIKFKKRHRVIAASTRGFHQASKQYEQDRLEYHKTNQEEWNTILQRWYKRIENWLGDDCVEELCGTVILSAEDGIADTIVPRLMVAGADRSMISILNAINEPEFDSQGNVYKTRERSVNLQNDLPHFGLATPSMYVRQ